MELGDVWAKVANQGRLTPQEIDFLKREGRNTQLRNSLIAGNTSADGSLSVPLQFFPIFSERLETAKASITIPIPGGYRNIIIKGSGSVDTASGGNIWGQANNDAGASNYAWHLISGDGGTVGAIEDTSFHAFALGVFGTTGAGAGVSGSFRSEIIGYSGNVWKKNILSQIYTSEFNAQYVTGSTWASTAPIQSIKIFGTNNTLVEGTANLAAGCEFAVYLEK